MTTIRTIWRSTNPVLRGIRYGLVAAAGFLLTGVIAATTDGGTGEAWDALVAGLDRAGGIGIGVAAAMLLDTIKLNGSDASS